MKIKNLETSMQFKNNNYQQNKQNGLIDKFTNAIKNPNDVNDCVAVPRGIFKAYLLIMFGSGILTIKNALPNKWKTLASLLTILGTTLNILSAVFFAKPFVIKDLNPTIKKENK